MGRTHVLSTGALALACAAPLSEHYLHRPVTLGILFAFVAVTAGYGLLPDIDHPSSTLARTFGPVTRLVAKIVGSVSGGHRKFTHTVFFAALMIPLVNLVVLRTGDWGKWVIATLGFYLAAMVLHLAPRNGAGEVVYLAEAAAATSAYQHFVGDWWWLPWAVAFGVIGHIVGDILTTEGVPVVYPLARDFVVRIPILGSTDHWREHAFAAALVPVCTWLAFTAGAGRPFLH